MQAPSDGGVLSTLAPLGRDQLQRTTTGRGLRAGRLGAACGLSLTATLFTGTPFKWLGIRVTVRTPPAPARAYQTARA